MPGKKRSKTPRGTIVRNLPGAFKTPEEATAGFLKEIAQDLKTDDPQAFVEVVAAEPPERKEDFWLIYYLKKAPPSNPVQVAESAGQEPRPTLSRSMVPLDKIVITKDNPRLAMDDEQLQGLIASIKEVGQREPINVRPLPDGRFELVSGHRRVRALSELGRTEAWAVVEETDEKKRRLLMGVHNMNREDLNPIDLAHWLDDMLREHPELGQEELARICGHTQSWVANHVRLLKAPKDLQDKLISREMTPRHVMELLPLAGYPIYEGVMEKWQKHGGGEVTVGALHDIIEQEITRDYDCKKILNLSELPYGMRHLEEFFDRSGCKGCERKISAKRYGSKPTGNCIDPECWKVKLKDAEAKHAAEMERRKKERQSEIVTADEKEARNGEPLMFCYFDLTECLTCGQLRRSKENGPVCLDATCRRRKDQELQKAKGQVTRQVTVARNQFAEQFLEELFLEGSKASSKRDQVTNDCIRIAFKTMLDRLNDNTEMKAVLSPWMSKEDKSPNYHESRDKIMKRINEAGDWEKGFIRLIVVASARGKVYGFSHESLRCMFEDPAKGILKQASEAEKAAEKSKEELLKGWEKPQRPANQPHTFGTPPSTEQCDGCDSWNREENRCEEDNLTVEICEAWQITHEEDAEDEEEEDEPADEDPVDEEAD